MSSSNSGTQKHSMPANSTLRPADRRLQRPLAIATCVYVLLFIPLRLQYAWMPESPVSGLAFFVFEMIMHSSFLGFIVTLLASQHEEPGTPSVDTEFEVDVFIPTLNEDLALVRRTVRRALKISHPHQTWILDDGDRPEVRQPLTCCVSLPHLSELRLIRIDKNPEKSPNDRIQIRYEAAFPLAPTH